MNLSSVIVRESQSSCSHVILKMYAISYHNRASYNFGYNMRMVGYFLNAPDI